MTDHADPLAAELADLPVPPLDPDFAAGVQRQARAELRERPSGRSWWGSLALFWREATVPTLLLLTGAFYAVAAAQQLLRSYVG